MRNFCEAAAEVFEERTATTIRGTKAPAGWGLPADLTNDGRANLVDLGLWVGYWLSGDSELPADPDRNGIVDMADYALFGRDWAHETSWYGP